MRTDSELVDAARRAAEKAYAPYSNFRVGASVLTSEGAMFSSANVENAAYPVSQCAEANAINFAVSQGMTSIPVVAVACIDATDVAGSYPCGRCRQIMSEFGVQRVLVTTAEGEIREHTLDELLPFRFEL
ncbi:MAG TPA: cytidine deaminase [Acidimicrobiia bacterium]|jgi:cytidine deaminase